MIFPEFFDIVIILSVMQLALLVGGFSFFHSRSFQSDTEVLFNA